MKKINIILVLLVSTMITLSCDKDRGRSWPPIPPIAVSVYVEDKYGRDLLDPDSKYFFADSVVLEHRGSEYRLYNSKIETKSYVSRYVGLSLMNKHGRYYLSFGAFDNITDYETDFIFHWKNNTTDTIHYIRYRDYDLHVLCEKWQLNGVEATHPIVIKKAIGH